MDLLVSLLQILPKCWQKGVQTKTFLSWVSASVAALHRTSLSFGILFAIESVFLNLCLLTFQEQSFEIHTGSVAALLSMSPPCPVALCAHSVSSSHCTPVLLSQIAAQAAPPLGQAEELPGSWAKRRAIRAHGGPVGLCFHGKWKKWDTRCSRNKAVRLKWFGLFFSYHNQPNKQTPSWMHTKKWVNSSLIAKSIGAQHTEWSSPIQTCPTKGHQLLRRKTCFWVLHSGSLCLSLSSVISLLPKP